MEHSNGQRPDRTADRTFVLRRAANVLEAFDDDHLVLSLHELSARAGLPKSTTHRFVEQLLRIGWLETTVGGYRAGIRLFELGGLVQRRIRLRESALPCMSRLADRFNCIVHLGILDSHDAVCIEKFPIRSFDASTRQGGRMPLHCTSIGKALLAFSNREEVDKAIEFGLPSKTNHTIVDPDAFRDELSMIRKTGVAFDREENVPGFTCVGAPIRSSGKAIGAISLTGRTRTFDLRTTADAAKQAATEIWRVAFSTNRSN